MRDLLLRLLFSDVGPPPPPTPPKFDPAAYPGYFDLAIAGIAVCVALWFMIVKLIPSWSLRIRVFFWFACSLTVFGYVWLEVAQRMNTAQPRRVKYEAELTNYKQALKHYKPDDSRRVFGNGGNRQFIDQIWSEEARRMRGPPPPALPED